MGVCFLSCLTNSSWELPNRWIYENREALVDPLGLVEEVYSDFDYPREITLFVRYMPMEGPDLGNREQNEARMFDDWKAYLEEAGKRFGRPV